MQIFKTMSQPNEEKHQRGSMPQLAMENNSYNFNVISKLFFIIINL